jgi:hypothetical protein
MTRHPVLRPGDTLRLGGETRTVAGLDGATVRLLADPSLELVTGSRVPVASQPALERLPAETVDNARWWERHLIEVITGVPPGSPPGTRPRPEYDPARRSLRQRELAKHDELTLAGHRVGLSTVKRRAAACSPAVTRSAPPAPPSSPRSPGSCAAGPAPARCGGTGSAWSRPWAAARPAWTATPAWSRSWPPRTRRRPICSRPQQAQMDAGCGAGACSTRGAAAVSSWLARYSAIVRSRP